AGAFVVVIGFSLVFVSFGKRLIALIAFPSSGLFFCRLRLVNHCSTGHADDPVLGIRASRTADCADDRSALDQWNATARRDNSIEREQIVEMHQIDTVLEDLGGTPEGYGCSRLVLR